MAFIRLKSFLFIFLFVSFFTWAKEQSYYEILGISKIATQEQIKTAYREHAKKWHPDRYSSAEEIERATKKFQEINTAYQTLKDPQKRKRYDQFGHQNWTSSFAQESESQRGDFYSEVFKDIFNKTENVSERKISKKSLYLFRQLILLRVKDVLSPLGAREKIRQDFLFEKLFKEFKISGLNKSARERIIQDIDFLYANEVKDILELNKSEDQKEERLKMALKKFINQVENRYAVDKISSKERQAVELFYQFSFFNQKLSVFLENYKRKLELLEREQEKRLTKEEKKELYGFQKEERKDLNTFRKILSSLALPSQTHHEFLLRSYLDGLKSSIFHEKFGGDKLLSDFNGSHKRFYMEDREIIKSLREVKSSFDSLHYENLRKMANPFKANFLKNFPGQFIIFQAAIGASLYRKAVSDPYFYGADRNPELLFETMNHSLTPSGVVSFFIFVAVSQQINYRLYGVGRRTNKKFFREIAPGAGLGTGFFVSSLFDELIHDPHLAECAQTLYKEKTAGELLRSHTSPCESFYNNWSRSEKWKHYVVDIFTLIGSGFLSHKFINFIVSVLRLTAVGSNFMIGATRMLGRFAGWGGFFVHMFFFMEFHYYLDMWVGQPLKEQLSAGGVKNALLNLTNSLNQDLSAITFYVSHSKEGLKDYFKDMTTRIEGKVKAVGTHFEGWAHTASRAYSQSASLWSQQTNKLLLPYTASSQLLKEMFVLSQFVYNSDVNKNQAWDTEKQVAENPGYWSRLNTRSLFARKKFLEELNQKRKAYQEKYCSQINDNFTVWKAFCDNPEEFSVDESWNLALFYETAWLIFNHLEEISLKNNHELNPIHYIGLGSNEMFSSDPKHSVEQFNYEVMEYGGQEVRRVSYDKQFELARELIKAGLDFENSWSRLSSSQMSQLRSELCSEFSSEYIDKNPESRHYCFNASVYLREVTDTCKSQYPTDQNNYKNCVQFFDSSEQILKQRLSFKLLSAGIYLLKDIGLKAGNKGPIAFSFFGTTQPVQDSVIFHSVLELLEFIEVYKKGEQKFTQAQEILIKQKELLKADQEKDTLEKQFELTNPYILAKNMICGSQQKEEKFLFSSKRFFKSHALFMYDFLSNHYQPIDKMCERELNREGDIHSFLFDIPAQLKGQEYENLYLALEELLKSYSSTQELERAFKSLSQNQLDSIGDTISQDLDLITENYYKDVIEPDSSVNANSSLEDFLRYYSRQKVVFDIRSFTGGLKGLEISIFQVNYWLETLKTLLLKGEQKQTQLNKVFNLRDKEFIFDLKDFELMQKEILSLFQSYNDTFKKAQAPYFVFPDKKRMVELSQRLAEQNERQVSVLDVLKTEYSSSSQPIMLGPEMLLSHVLAHSLPGLNNLAQIRLITKGETFQEGWEQLIYSVLFELNKSLMNFFGQIYPLQLKEGFEDQRQSL